MDQSTRKKYTYWRIRTFLGLYLGYAAYYFTRKNLAFVGSFLISDLGFSRMEYGILDSTIGISYGVGKFFTGMISDRYKIRTFMVFGLAASSIVCILFSFFHSLPILTFLWGMNGALQSIGFPSAAKGMVYWFSQKERGITWSTFLTSKAVGVALIGIVASYCISLGYWRAVFYIPGMIGVLISFSLFFVLKDTPASVGLPPIEDFKNDYIPSKKEETNISHLETLKKYVFKNPYLWLLAMVSTCLYFIRFTILDWGVIFMVDHGISPTVATFVLTFVPIAAAIGGIAAGLVCDKIFKGRAVPVMIIFLLLLIINLWAMHHFTNANSAIFTIAIFFALSAFFSEGPQNILGVVQTKVSIKEAVGATFGFIGFFEYIGATLVGVGTALILQYFDWNTMFFLRVFLVVAIITMLLFVYKKEKALIK